MPYSIGTTQQSEPQITPAFRDHYAQFGDKILAELAKQLDGPEARLNAVK